MLSDAQKRRMYDQFGHDGPAGFSGGNPGGGYYSYSGSGFSGFEDFDLGDIFSSIFGGGSSRNSRRNNGPIKGADLKYSMDITFEEAFLGVEKEINIYREETCKTCSGSGAKPGTSPETCQTCKGTGTVRTVQNTILGQMQTTKTCSACHGTGKVIKEVCEACRGKGTVRKQAKIKVKIPAGIDNEQSIVLRGEGDI